MFVLGPEKLKIEDNIIEVVDLKVLFSRNLIFAHTNWNFTLPVASLENSVY